MRYAPRKVVLLVTILFSYRPVHAAMAGTMQPDQAALRVMLSLAVAWILVGLVAGVAHSYGQQRPPEPADPPPGTGHDEP
ncbi:hypothetical protein acdb102_25560 [Acidothermaceae bacterium B102]|nr:hypothetical protein acdb102_25560 [Acidothermaceae bacterium B102]